MTVFGRHTAGELKDLLAAKDFDIDRILENYNAFRDKWIAKNRAEHDAWKADWDEFERRYGVAHFAATKAINESVTGLVEDEYQGVLLSLRRTPDGGFANTDFQGLYVRLAGAIGGNLDFKGQPQPAALDADLEGFKASDSAVRAVESVARGADDASTKLIIGLGVAALLVYLVKK